MGGQAWVYGLRDEWRGLQEPGHCCGVPLVLPHAEVECLQTSVGQVAVKWAGHHSHRWEGEEGRGGGRRERGREGGRGGKMSEMEEKERERERGGGGGGRRLQHTTWSTYLAAAYPFG